MSHPEPFTIGKLGMTHFKRGVIVSGYSNRKVSRAFLSKEGTLLAILKNAFPS
jgi:hypothetical protein